MKKINLSKLFVLFVLNYGVSQDIINNELLNEVSNRQLINANKSNIENIIGSPYINPNYLPVNVYKLTGENWSARYNAYNDEIEIKKENSSTNYLLSKKSKFSKVEFVSSKIAYEAYDYTENGEKKRGYLAQLNPTGNCLLLKRQRIIFVEAKPSKTGYDEETPALFKKAKDKYFIKTSDGNIVELKKNKKDFAKLFPKYEKKILSYFKKQGINTKKETDLIKLIHYVNTFN